MSYIRKVIKKDRLRVAETIGNDRMRRVYRALGLPPKYNMDIDPQYSNKLTPGYGRVYAKAILSTPTILSICPGSVTMFPNFNLKEKTSFLDGIKKVSKGIAAVSGLNLASSKGSSGVLQLYDFKPDTQEYAKKLNMLCRTSSILMNIGDMNMPGTGIKLRDFDYASWRDPETYWSSKPENLRSAIMGDFSNAFKNSASGVINDNNYVHFFVNNSETSSSENIETSTTSPAILSEIQQQLGDISSNLAYYLGGKGSGLNDGKDYKSSMVAALEAVTGANGQEWSTAVESMGKNLLSGGKIVFPDGFSCAIWRSIIYISKLPSTNMQFISIIYATTVIR